MRSRLAWALAAALPLAAQTSVDLGGYWERWLGDSLYDSVRVPSSYRPIGTARLRRSVSIPQFGGEAPRRSRLRRSR